MKLKQNILLITFLSVVFMVKAQESQNDLLVSYETGKYSVYKLANKKSYQKQEFEKVNKQWPIEISKERNQVSQVLVKRAGIIDEVFKPDVPGYPAYFAYKTYRLTFLKDYAVYYEWNGKQEAKAKYIFVKPGKSFNKKPEEVNLNVKKYAVATFKNQTNARATVKQEKQVLAESERLKNSLQNKEVSKIEIKLLKTPSHVAHFSDAIPYGIIATLKDGSQLKTPNLGGQIPWDDFILKNEGCTNTIDEVRVEEDASKIPNDKIEIHATSKFHPSLKASKSINCTYDISIQSSASGFWGWERQKYMTILQGVDGQHAGRGDNVTIKIVATKHKQTGKSINKIEIYNETKQKIIARYKLTPETELIVNVTGGTGEDGRKGREGESVGGNGGDGGAGGNVSIIKSSSVQKYTITIKNKGGKGGNGGPPYYSTGIKGNNGQNGEDGTTTTQTKNVNLNF
ncbi:MAG: hypothetical protein ACWA45_00580 [Flavobacteriales bacterium]